MRSMNSHTEKKYVVDDNNNVVDVEVAVADDIHLERRFGLGSAIATGICTGNTWAALGGTIVTSFYNGGPSGILYEFIAVSVCYWFVGASIAELASAIPASGGVYHWAAATAGKKYGIACAYFAGWLNFCAWLFTVPSTCCIIGQGIVYCYQLFHPDSVFERYQVFIVYLIVCWAQAFIVMFGTKMLPTINTIGCILIVAGFFITIIVCAVMPHVNGTGYASSKFVWKTWDNQLGYSSDGFTFLLGMLNGAYAVGTPDCVTHLAEEIDSAGRNLPIVLLCQISVGFVTAICYMTAMFYAITDIDAIFAAGSIFPLGDIYLQATGSKGGALGLIIVILLPTFCVGIGCYITCGRTLYALARDNATPLPTYFGSIDKRFKSPLYATLCCAVISTCIGAIYVGTTTAFSAFIGSFILLTTSSFLLCIIPHLLHRRSIITPGPFWLGKWGFLVNIVACLYMIVFFVIYCFPYNMPVTPELMNYSSVIIVGLAVAVSFWWLFAARRIYKGPELEFFEVTDSVMRLVQSHGSVVS